MDKTVSEPQVKIFGGIFSVSLIYQKQQGVVNFSLKGHRKGV